MSTCPVFKTLCCPFILIIYSIDYCNRQGFPQWMKKNLWTLGSIIPYNQSPTNLGFEHWLNTAHWHTVETEKKSNRLGKQSKSKNSTCWFYMILSPIIYRQEIRGWSQKDIISLSSGKVLEHRVCNVEIYRKINSKSRLLVFRSSIPMQ